MSPAAPLCWQRRRPPGRRRCSSSAAALPAGLLAARRQAADAVRRYQQQRHTGRHSGTTPQHLSAPALRAERELTALVLQWGAELLHGCAERCPAVLLHGGGPALAPVEARPLLPPGRPDGWLRFELRRPRGGDYPGRSELHSEAARRGAAQWVAAYHGTAARWLPGVLREGLRPGARTRKIYAAPSLWVASNPAYAPLFQLPDPDSAERWGQAALELRVRPGSWVAHHMTMDHTRWDRGVRSDPWSPSQRNTEWALGSASDVCVVAVLVRELGRGSRAAELFGQLAGRVYDSGGIEGPNEHWAGLMQAALREGGYLTDPSDPMHTPEWWRLVEEMEEAHEHDWRSGGGSGPAPPLPWNPW
eukprot:TRINITY_DN40963_c0_g1_i1.p1 TRINITY_DN40963_c0_g1~~TRINITY_DN40963_c0_g1_i1.p1  ORF type:complete len:361 (+),score=72.29 TRINITY_DN40963_c0_g1_i1:113-1195(+)